MRSFKDRHGRAWVVELTVGAVKRVKALAGFDVLTIVTGGTEVFGEFLGDAVRQCEALYAICKPEADTAGVTLDMFLDAIAGDSLLEARDVLVEEITDFFPDPRTRINLRALIQKARQVTEIVQRQGGEAITEIDVQKEAEKILASLKSGK